MLTQTPECPRCRRAMEPGFLMDHGHGVIHKSTWVAGLANWSKWLGVRIKKGTPKFEATTYRCPSCGRLESYATVETK